MTQFRTALSVISVVSILFSTPSLSYAGLICGGSKIEVINSSNQKEPHFLVQISKGERTLKVPYSAEQEFLFLRCEQNAEGKPFLLVNSLCGGSGCSESNFGVINLQQLMVLLAPNQRWKGNQTLAEKLLGKSIKPFTCKNPSRSSQAKLLNGELCYVSPLQLG